jgi:threonine/homoserine/homoserine lactone efflux protein
MFDLSNLIIFITAGLALNFTPGPDMIYCATRSVGQGRAAGVVSALGVGTGALVHTAAAIVGLSALLIYSSTAFLVVKYAGAVYLAYLGVRMILSGRTKAGPERLPSASLWQVYRQGAVTNILNPKVALFFMSFLPQFVDPSRGSASLQILILALIVNFTGTTVNALVGLLFGSVGNWLDRKPAFWRWQRRVTGSILVGLGLSLALPGRR